MIFLIYGCDEKPTGRRRSQTLTLKSPASIVEDGFREAYREDVFLIPSTPAGDSISDLLKALRAVETGGEVFPENAIGDNGRSRGPYQIGRDYWADAVEFATKNAGIDPAAWDYDELVWSAPHCEQIMLWYWGRWCPEALAAASDRYDRGDMSALQTLARVHNGGPRGASKTSTLDYWQRVSARMKNKWGKNA